MLQWLMAGAASFAATNVDDILVLVVFFSQVGGSFRVRHVVVGQYLGFAALLGVSFLGFAGSLVVPRPLIGLLGLVPVAIGLHKLATRGREGERVKVNAAADEKLAGFSWGNVFPPQTYKVAAVTIANGGDNVGVYIPLFAASGLAGMLVILTVFLVLIGVWCLAGYALARQPAVAAAMSRYGHIVVPFVLIGLGLFILLESGALSLLGLQGVRGIWETATW